MKKQIKLKITSRSLKRFTTALLLSIVAFSLTISSCKKSETEISKDVLKSYKGNDELVLKVIHELGKTENEHFLQQISTKGKVDWNNYSTLITSRFLTGLTIRFYSGTNSSFFDVQLDMKTKGIKFVDQLNMGIKSSKNLSSIRRDGKLMTAENGACSYVAEFEVWVYGGSGSCRDEFFGRFINALHNLGYDSGMRKRIYSDNGENPKDEIERAFLGALNNGGSNCNLEGGFNYLTVTQDCDGGGTTAPEPARDIRNKVADPCISKTVNALLTSNMNIEGVMSDIIKKFDQTKAVSINIFDGEIYYDNTTTPKPGETSGQTLSGNKFTANITLGKTYHLGTSKENVVATLIHEVVHAYLGYSANNLLRTEEDHKVIASDYITPMADYLKSYFNIPLKDAYAIAWSGVPDAKVWQDAPEDFEFTMSDGNKITKAETKYLSAPYKDINTDPYAKGTPICQ